MIARWLASKMPTVKDTGLKWQNEERSWNRIPGSFRPEKTLKIIKS